MTKTHYWIAIITVSFLLRAGIDSLQQLYRARVGFFDFSVLVIFGLPLLEVLTLLFLLAFLLIRSGITQKTTLAGQFVFLPLWFNAIWRIVDYIRSYDSCLVTSGGAHEGFCSTVGFQIFFHVPFVLLGLIVLSIFLFRRSR